MSLKDLLKRDLAEISKEVGSRCTIKGRNGTASFIAVVSDASHSNAGYVFAEGQAVNATCQFNGEDVKFEIVIGDKFIADDVQYRISTITRTIEDSALTLSLVVEGKR